jgi:hypothetical protein
LKFDLKNDFKFSSRIPVTQTKFPFLLSFGKHAFSPAAALWILNEIPISAGSSASIFSFKHKLKSHCFAQTSAVYGHVPHLVTAGTAVGSSHDSRAPFIYYYCYSVTFIRQAQPRVINELSQRQLPARLHKLQPTRCRSNLKTDMHRAASTVLCFQLSGSYICSFKCAD